jgi:ribose transport system substrate-binding protein
MIKMNIKRCACAVLCISLVYVYLHPQGKIKIAIVPRNNSDLFWKTAHTGAKLASVALGDVEVIWRAPSDDVTLQQISIVEQCIAEGISGIALAPLEKDSLAMPVAKAAKKKIPVLILDSALKGTPGKDFIGFVGINNRKAGELAGEHLARLLKGKGRVVLLRNLEGQANTTEREEGFLEAIAKHEGIQLIVKDRYAGNTVDKARKVSMNILNRFKEVDGIFCPNERSTIGMLLALRDANLAGKVRFIGFDTPALVLEALKNGEIDALIVQNPSLMGYLSVKTIVDYIHKKKIAPTIDTGVQLIIRENLGDADVQKLLALPGIVEQNRLN